MNKPYIIFYAGKHPVKCHRNLRGPVYEFATLDTASRFETEEAAAHAAVMHGVPQFTVGEELTAPPPDREAGNSETVHAASPAGLFPTSALQPHQPSTFNP
jgi:hypothetical protein